MIDRYLKLSNYVTQALLTLQRNRASKVKAPAVMLTDEEGALVEVRDLLSPLQLVTSEISSEKNVIISKCIPLVKILKAKTMEYCPTTPIGFNVKAALMAEIDNRFKKLELENTKCAVATLLDPRFKRLGFTQSDEARLATSRAIKKVGELVSNLQPTNAQQRDTSEVLKQENARSDIADSLWNDHEGEVRQVVDASGYSRDYAGGIPAEILQYLNRHPISKKQNPDLWNNPFKAWDTMKGEFPNLYLIARRYLAIMATSVPSERLFSHAGLISNQLRSGLGKHLEQLVFLRS